MAVVRVTENPATSGTNSIDGSRTYDRSFLVAVDSLQDDQQVVLAAAGLPKLGDYYQYASSIDIAAVATNVTATRRSLGWMLWDVNVRYEVAQGRRTTLSPFEEPIIFDTSTQTIEEEIHVDKDGNPLISPNGEPQPETIRITEVVITAKQNIPNAGNLLKLQFDYHDKINSAAFFGLPAGCVKIDGISLHGPIYRGPYVYVEATWRFVCRAPTYGGFNKKRVYKSRFHNIIDGGVRKRKTILDFLGVPVGPVIVAPDGTEVDIEDIDSGQVYEQPLLAEYTPSDVATTLKTSLDADGIPINFSVTQKA